MSVSTATVTPLHQAEPQVPDSLRELGYHALTAHPALTEGLALSQDGPVLV